MRKPLDGGEGRSYPRTMAKLSTENAISWAVGAVHAGDVNDKALLFSLKSYGFSLNRAKTILRWAKMHVLISRRNRRFLFQKSR